VRAAPLALAAALACAPALRAPRPIPELGGAPQPSGRSAAALLEDARAAFARRPDAREVKRAEALFLAAAEADPKDAEGLYGAIQAKIWLAGREPDARARAALASTAVDAGQWCARRAPADARCDYGLALALGLRAREQRGTALDALKVMVQHLRRAAAEDPAVDRGGPERVLAIVLARAPAWPVGPGDAEAALAEARKAERRFPDHAPNLLALAEALLATGDADAGHAAARRALALARGEGAAGDPDAGEWIREAERLAVAPAAAGGTAAGG
jgi:tetratricopeptide (TPR) repeat protein